jgi:kynurenine 3-monooxygenase
MMSHDVPLLDNTRKVVVVGAGPVGCLAAIAFAKMNWQVEIYEARPGKAGQCQCSRHAMS